MVYHGSHTGLSVTPNWTAESNQAETDFANSAGTTGDVNGDGYSDVIVGARHLDHGEDREGAAFVFLGSSDGLAVVPSWSAESNLTGAHFGSEVGSAGDVNADGYAEAVVGASIYTHGQEEEGAVSSTEGVPLLSNLGIEEAWIRDAFRAGS